jgi:hypothetical protein
LLGEINAYLDELMDDLDVVLLAQSRIRTSINLITDPRLAASWRSAVGPSEAALQRPRALVGDIDDEFVDVDAVNRAIEVLREGRKA